MLMKLSLQWSLFCVLQLTSVSQITTNNDVAERVGQHEICALRRCHLKSIAALAYSRENLDSGQYTWSALLKLRVERPSLPLVPLYTMVRYAWVVFTAKSHRNSNGSRCLGSRDRPETRNLTESPASTPTPRRFLHPLRHWIWTLERQINGRRPSAIIIAHHNDMSLGTVAARLATLAGDQTSGQGQALISSSP